jgi:hypothetical protein
MRICGKIFYSQKRKNPHTTDLFLFKNAATIFYNCNFNCSDQMNPLMNISINVLILLLLYLLERKVIEGRLTGIKGEFDGSNHGMFPDENRHDNGKYAIGKKWYPIDDDESGWESESLKKEQEKLTENGSFNSSVKEHQPDLYNSDQVDAWTTCRTQSQMNQLALKVTIKKVKIAQKSRVMECRMLR